MLSALAAELKQISTANPFAINLADAVPILSFIGTMTFIWLVGLLYFSHMDRAERKHIIKSSWDPNNQPIHSSEFLKNGFPEIISRKSDEDPLYVRVWNTVIEEHYVTNFIFGEASLLRSRLNRWLECWYNIIVMLFVDSLFYGITYSNTHRYKISSTHSLRVQEYFTAILAFVKV